MLGNKVRTHLHVPLMNCKFCCKRTTECERCHDRTAVDECIDGIHICKKCQDYFASEDRYIALFAVLFVVAAWIHNRNELVALLALALVVSVSLRRCILADVPSFTFYTPDTRPWILRFPCGKPNFT